MKFSRLRMIVRNYCHSLSTDVVKLVRSRRKRDEQGRIIRRPWDIVTMSTTTSFLQVYGGERSTDLIILMCPRRHLYVINFSLFLSTRLSHRLLRFSLRFFSVFPSPSTIVTTRAFPPSKRSIRYPWIILFQCLTEKSSVVVCFLKHHYCFRVTKSCSWISETILCHSLHVSQTLVPAISVYSSRLKIILKVVIFVELKTFKGT